MTHPIQTAPLTTAANHKALIDRIPAHDALKRLQEFAQFIVDGYDNVTINHEDFRVEAYINACAALGIKPPIEGIFKDLNLGHKGKKS